MDDTNDQRRTKLRQAIGALVTVLTADPRKHPDDLWREISAGRDQEEIARGLVNLSVILLMKLSTATGMEVEAILLDIASDDQL